MDITQVRLSLIQPEREDSKQLAIGSIVIDNSFAVHGIRVVQGPNGAFVSMPSRKGADGQYHDVAHPITGEARQKIIDAVLAEYDRTCARTIGEPDPEPQQQAAAGAQGTAKSRPAKAPSEERDR